MLAAYTIIDDGRVDATAGERVRMARPFVGVVWNLLVLHVRRRVPRERRRQFGLKVIVEGRLWRIALPSVMVQAVVVLVSAIARLEMMLARLCRTSRRTIRMPHHI